MKIYIEAVIILNLYLDYCILIGTKYVLKRKVSNKRILLGSMIGCSIIPCLYYSIGSLELVIIKLTISVLMNLIAFGKQEWIKNTFYFYIVSIITGGTIELLNIKLSYYRNLIFLLIISPIVIKLCIYTFKKIKVMTEESYQVKVFMQEKQYNFKGFIDTGNLLKSPISQKSIILIEDVIPKAYGYFIPYKALNYEGLLEIIKPDKIIINEQEIKNCLIGISKNKFNFKNYNCILPSKIKEDL